MDEPGTQPTELSEQELADLLSFRDREQELKRRHLSRWVSIILAGFVMTGLIAIFSFKSSRELVSYLFGGAPPPPAPVAPLSLPIRRRCREPTRTRCRTRGT